MSKNATSVLSANLTAQKKIPDSGAVSDERVYSLATDLPQVSASHVSAQLTHYEDDISLVDVALLIVKHKRVLFRVFAGILLLGALTIVLMPKVYDYSAVIEVGSYRLPEQDGALGVRQEIESITQVKSKLEKRFIAAALLAYNQQFPDAGLPSVKVNAPAESNVVQLSVKGDQQQSEKFLGLLKQISADLIADHNEKLLDVREQVMQSIDKQRIKVGEYAAKLDNAKANQAAVRKSIAELTQEKAMLAQQLDRMDRNLEKINKLKIQYNAEPQNAREGITLLLLDNQLIETQKMRDKLEKQNIVGVSEKSAKYAIKIAATEEAVSMNQLLYANAQQVLQRYLGEANAARLATVDNNKAPSDVVVRAEPSLNIDSTVMVVAPHRSAQPASLPTSVMLGLLVFLALFFSLMSVFVYEFTQKVKSQARSQ